MNADYVKCDGIAQTALVFGPWTGACPQCSYVFSLFQERTECRVPTHWRVGEGACDAIGCDRVADWAYIGEGGDLYLCDLHGGTEEVEGWQRIVP